MKPIEFDITSTLDKFNKLHKSMDFIISKSLNDIAFDKGRKDISKEIHRTMENRNKFFSSERAIRIKRSSTKNLEVELFHFNENMGLQQFGGVELPKGKKLAIPVRKNLQRYLGVSPTKKIPKAVSIQTMMNKAPRNRGQTEYKVKGKKPFILDSGIFINVNGNLKYLYVFAKDAKHKKKLLDTQKVIEKTYNRNFDRYFQRNFLRLLKG